MFMSIFAYVYTHEWGPVWQLHCYISAYKSTVLKQNLRDQARC